MVLKQPIMRVIRRLAFQHLFQQPVTAEPVAGPTTVYRAIRHRKNHGDPGHHPGLTRVTPDQEGPRGTTETATQPPQTTPDQ